jgi:hypothetical protein
MKKSLAPSFAALAVLAGCASTLPITSGGIIERNTGKKVTSAQSVYNFLGLNPLSLDASEKAIADLQSQCGGKNVTGVTVLATWNFAFFGSRDAIETSGYCAE